ncbi:MAG: hypothetical protein ACON4U_17890 [Myxococcota bacterium]
MKNAIAWYRPNPIPQLLGIGTISAVMMVTGVIVMAFGIDQSGRIAEEWKNPAIVCGVLTVIAGVLHACIRFYKTLEADKTVLVLNQSGIEYHHLGKVQSIQWQQLQNIHFGTEGLELTSTSIQLTINARFLGITGPKLEKKIKETQHQILLGVPVRE